jgi:hypothetical protein
MGFVLFVISRLRPAFAFALAVSLSIFALPTWAAAQSIGPVVPGPTPVLYNLTPFQLVQNGGMEQQDGLGQLAAWTRGGIATQISNTTAVTLGLPRAHCGSSYAGLQAYGPGRDAYVAQTITIPASAPAPHLTFWINGVGSLSTDGIVADLTTSSGSLLLGRYGAQAGPTNGWVQKGPFDLSAFRDLTVQLILRVNGTGSTWFAIDDVSVLTAYPNANTLLAPSAC